MVSVPFRLPALLADPKPPARPLVLANARIFDGTGAAPAEVSELVVVDGRIQDKSPPAGATFIELGGRFLMPGLIDAHAHLGEQVEVDLRGGVEPLLPAVRGHLVAAIARRALRMGITTVRDVGARGDDVLTVRQAMRHGAFIGPRILASGRIVSATSPGGHHFAGMYREADGPDEMRKAAREQIRRGADFVKIMVTGARSVELENPGPPQVTRGELGALVDEVHRQGYGVAAHCEGLEGTAMAIAEGVDTVEHGFYLNQRPELLELMATQGQTLVPTLTYLYGIVDQTHERWSDELIERGVYNVAEAEKTLRAAIEAGVNIAMGFDSRPEEMAASELGAMARAGMSSRDALISATSGGAHALGLEHLLGTIGDGMAADLAAIDGDPLDDLGVLTQPDRIHLVVRNGHIAHVSPAISIT